MSDNIKKQISSLEKETEKFKKIAKLDYKNGVAVARTLLKKIKVLSKNGEIKKDKGINLTLTKIKNILNSHIENKPTSIKKQISNFKKDLDEFRKIAKSDPRGAVDIAKSMIKKTEELGKIDEVKNDKKTLEGLVKASGILNLYVTNMSNILKFGDKHNK